jgi:hypothetical protein
MKDKDITYVDQEQLQIYKNALEEDRVIEMDTAGKSVEELQAMGFKLVSIQKQHNPGPDGEPRYTAVLILE